MIMKSKHRIAFVSEYDLCDVRVRSGVPFFIKKTLEDIGCEIIDLGNIKDKRSFICKIKGRLLTLFFNKILKCRLGLFLHQRSISYIKGISKQADSLLQNVNYDIVFSPDNLILSFINTSRPIVYWSDATFDNMLNYYPDGFSNLCKLTIKEAHCIERRSIKKSSLAIYTSEWAAKSAIDFYNMDPDKVKIIPRGANLLYRMNETEIRTNILKKDLTKYRLLFVAANWERKGGDLVVKVAKSLVDRGIDVIVHIVGEFPKEKYEHVKWLHYEGFLKKDCDEDQRRLVELYKKCHLFIMLSKYENFGIVFCEASAFGLPSVAFDTGGVAEAVRDGHNGKLFTVDSNENDIASYIIDLLSNREKYNALSLSSYLEFKTRLNWRSSCEKLIHYLEETNLV